MISLPKVSNWIVKCKGEFHKRRPGGSFEVSIQYLYERLTDSLLTLRKKKKDIYYDLLNNLCKARMLTNVHLKNVLRYFQTR